MYFVLSLVVTELCHFAIAALELVVPQLLSSKRSKFPFAGYILMKIVLVDQSSISVV